MVGADTEAVLGRLVDALGETANLAILSGSHAEYVAQVPSRHTMRMFTEVGRQVDLHCTGVGKALLGQLDDNRVREIIGRAGLNRQTEHTLVAPPTCWPSSPRSAPVATRSTTRSRRRGSAASPCPSGRSRCRGWRCRSPARSPG